MPFRGRSDTVLYVIDSASWTSSFLAGPPPKVTLDASFDKLDVGGKWPGSVINMVARFDRANDSVWCAYHQKNYENEKVILRRFNVKTLTWTHVATLVLPEDCVPKESDLTPHPICLTFASNFLLAWDPLQSRALYVFCSYTEPVLEWETCQFEGTRAPFPFRPLLSAIRLILHLLTTSERFSNDSLFHHNAIGDEIVDFRRLGPIWSNKPLLRS